MYQIFNRLPIVHRCSAVCILWCFHRHRQGKPNLRHRRRPSMRSSSSSREIHSQSCCSSIQYLPPAALHANYWQDPHCPHCHLHANIDRLPNHRLHVGRLPAVVSHHYYCCFGHNFEGHRETHNGLRRFELFPPFCPRRSSLGIHLRRH